MEVQGAFMLAWGRIEKAGLEIMTRRGLTSGSTRPMIPINMPRSLHQHGIVTERFAKELDEMRHIRNMVTHDQADHKAALTDEVMERVNRIANELEGIAKKSPAVPESQT